MGTLFGLTMTHDWSPLKGLLVWRFDVEAKIMLPRWEPKPCNPIPMKNVEDGVKNISGFLQYWDRLRVADVGGYKWSCRYLYQHSPLILRHGFWPQNCLDVHASKTRLLDNGKVREEIYQDDH